jgi:hypothetical protein
LRVALFRSASAASRSSTCFCGCDSNKTQFNQSTNHPHNNVSH